MVSALIPSGPNIYSRFDGTIDPYLDLMLSEHSEDDIFRAVVQFKGWPIDDDIEYAKSIGLEHISSMKTIPGAYFDGTKEDFEILSGYPRTY